MQREITEELEVKEYIMAQTGRDDQSDQVTD